MAIIPLGNFPGAVGFPGAQVGPQIGPVVVTSLALLAISQLPKAEALGHAWKHVDRNYYDSCKDIHGWKGQVCFWACFLEKHISK